MPKSRSKTQQSRSDSKGYPYPIETKLGPGYLLAKDEAGNVLVSFSNSDEAVQVALDAAMQNFGVTADEALAMLGSIKGPCRNRIVRKEDVL